jgi:hypothetical protein
MLGGYTEELMDYNADLAIEFDNLAENWRDQQMLYMKYGEEHANKMRERDRLKESLDIIKAERGAHIREMWETEGFDKAPTVDGVNGWVTRDEQTQEAVKKLIGANHDMNVLHVAKSAFEHRKKALESLTQLYLIGYFSKPRLQEETSVQKPHGDPQQKALDTKHKRRKRR